MITPEIKTLFQFIEYLHSNIENFNQYKDLIDELWLLGEKRKELRPNDNYKDRLQYDKIQAEIEIKFDELQDKTANPIKAKAKELNICSFDNEPFYISNGIATEIHQLKKNFSKDDISEIFKHKNQYIEFRKNDYRYFLSLYFFFLDLDRTTKALFDFFKEPTAQNEYEAFETKVIRVNNAKEAFELMRKGELCAFNINPLNPSIVQQQPNIEAFPPQPIVKQKPQPNGKLITFKNSEIIEKIHTELKGYFPNKEGELLKALQGEQLTEMLLFPHNQNKFVEVFRRLKYNGFLLNTDTETKNWICTTFQFIKKGFAEPQPFNECSVWDNLNKGKGEPTKKERICIAEWLPYKSPLQLTRETENEKL